MVLDYELQWFPFIVQGITFDEFRSFFQFLNNLEDFAIAMKMYNFASRSIGQGLLSLLILFIAFTVIAHT